MTYSVENFLRSAQSFAFKHKALCTIALGLSVAGILFRGRVISWLKISFGSTQSTKEIGDKTLRDSENSNKKNTVDNSRTVDSSGNAPQIKASISIRYKDTEITFVDGDLLIQKVDAIVVIADEEHAKGMRIGEALMEDRTKVEGKKVIYAFWPLWIADHVTLTTNLGLIRTTYTNILKAATEAKINSIALSFISKQPPTFPADLVAMGARTALKKYIDETPLSSVKNIIFALSGNTFDAFAKALQGINTTS